MTTTEIERPWFCSESRDSEEWQWGGEKPSDADRTGRDLWLGGFWIAPAHKTTTAERADGMEHPYTVETCKATWIPAD